MPTSQSLVERVEAAHRQVAKLRSQFRRGNVITIIVGAVLLGLLCFYFAYGYSAIAGALKPDLLVKATSGYVDQQLPTLIATIETHVRESAPAWAEQASKQLLDAAPTLREELEKLTLDRTNALVEHINVVGDKEFRKVLNEHRDEFKQVLDTLATNQEPGKDVLAPLHAALDKELGVDMHAQASAVLGSLIEMNDKLKRLAGNRGLNAKERTERRVLMIMRRMHDEYLNKENRT
jgi:hypothetical protein